MWVGECVSVAVAIVKRSVLRLHVEDSFIIIPCFMLVCLR